MTLTEHKIWHMPLILLLAFWLGGCSMQYEGEEPGVKTNDYFLILNVHIGDVNRGFTRAASGNGLVFDHDVSDRELMNTLRVIIVNRHTRKIAHNDFIILPEASTIKEGLKYKVDFDTDYRVYLIANEEGLPDYQTMMFYDLEVGKDYSENLLEEKVIGSLTPGQPMIFDSQPELCIPMTESFDIKTAPKNTTPDESNEVIQNEKFFITRATTKFSFYFFRGKDSKPMESDKLVIDKVKISGLGQNEYLFPYNTDYYPSKESDKISMDRYITDFQLPEENNYTGEYVFDLPTDFDVSKLPERPNDFDPDNPTDGLEVSQIFKYIPELYFPESKGNASGNRFECTISYGDDKYLSPVVLPNLPHRLPRNTHVVVIITVNGVSIDVDVDIQPFAKQEVRFEFGLMRDDRGDLMVLPVSKLDENGEVVMTYPQYFLDFINDDNPNHKYPVEVDWDGTPSENLVKLEEGDYYAIVVGEYDDMSEATVWVKDRTGCHVLSNYDSSVDSECSARIVESFFGNNQSERFYKDMFGYRRVHHFDNHNSIVRHPELDILLFCMIENFQQPDQTRKYFEVESWDEKTFTGWIINKDSDGKETGFQKITSDGELGESVSLDGGSEGFGN